MLTRWRPMEEMLTNVGQLQDEMSRLLNRWGFERGDRNGTRMFSPATYPALNLWEDGDNLYIEAELPGFEMKDLEMYVTGQNQLSLRGRRNQPQSNSGTCHRQERGYGEFNRMIELPCAVSADKVTAHFKHGVLCVTLPKHEGAKPRRIEVKAS